MFNHKAEDYHNAVGLPSEVISSEVHEFLEEFEDAAKRFAPREFEATLRKKPKLILSVLLTQILLALHEARSKSNLREVIVAIMTLDMLHTVKGIQPDTFKTLSELTEAYYLHFSKEDLVLSLMLGGSALMVYGITQAGDK